MFDDAQFRDKTILITGATGGVGAATARLLRRAGAQVCLVARRAEPLHALAQELGAHAIAADLSRAPECERAVAETLDCHGRLDGLVNAAGIWVEGDSEHATEEDWDRCVDLNLKGLFFMCARAIPALRASRGAIVNIGSDAGLQGNAGAAIYCASKGGVTLLTKALARELAPSGVRVNVLCPADIMTPMLTGQAREYGGDDPIGYLRRLLARYPQAEHARFVRPEEVACMTAFLLSAEAAPITGAALPMDFGLGAGY
ncbi:SDR family NAD(P)-dependent oxidoreductase [Noviherbaspirillum aridicola]|uniref:Short-chain dehydrogenase n=1 Tax=Noviherbaspirillum aridicola TaxID=2849687 RepID=A0ABQ4Q5S6_9BURK|nr:SDR family oxidoreductase [Noviherbaspirillum aridicola]GIZ52160.1 short-chain dehydrogenase [Noviherbaspirillum aridicola]